MCSSRDAPDVRPHPVAQPSSPLELRAENAHATEHDQHPGTGDEWQRENEPDEDERDAEYDAARADGLTQHRGDPIVAARANEGQRLNGGGALSRRGATGMVALL